jgi:hypothetical protein
MERDDQNELNHAPQLRNRATENPFVVPDGFFDRFPQEVQQRIRTEARPGRGLRLGGALWPRLAIGSLVAAAMVATVWTVWPAAPLNAHSIASAEPEELLDAGVDEESLYAALAQEEDLMDPVALPNDNAELLAYLENQDLSLDLLIEDL